MTFFLKLCMLGNFSCFCCCLLSFSKFDFFKKFFQDLCLYPDQYQPSVGPDLGPISLQRLSADDKSQRAKKDLILHENISCGASHLSSDKKT